jgi:uncharacterized membrane protein
MQGNSLLQKSRPATAARKAISVTSPPMKLLAMLLVLLFPLEDVLAQGGKRHERPQRGSHQMSQEERQRMRQDMRDAYRDRSSRPERPQREMSPQERDKLRQDIEDANRNLRRER